MNADVVFAFMILIYFQDDIILDICRSRDIYFFYLFIFFTIIIVSFFSVISIPRSQKITKKKWHNTLVTFLVIFFLCKYEHITYWSHIKNEIMSVTFWHFLAFNQFEKKIIFYFLFQECIWDYEKIKKSAFDKVDPTCSSQYLLYLPNDSETNGAILNIEN